MSVTSINHADLFNYTACLYILYCLYIIYYIIFIIFILTFENGILEWFGLEGTFKDHLAKPLVMCRDVLTRPEPCPI